MVKRIILTCDGTWQTADAGTPGIPSNAARLSRMLACESRTNKGKTIAQVVYYQAGVGTGAVGFLDRVAQGITGAGLEDNVTKAYHFIATNYVEGDEVCLFGFSRGAYTARCIAWLLTKLGVLQPEDLVYFRGLYRVLKKIRGNLDFDDNSPYPELRGWSLKETIDGVSMRSAGTKGTDAKSATSLLSGPLESDFKPRTRRRTIPKPIVIKVIGVWDTVGALGLPDSLFSRLFRVNREFQFYDTSLSTYIQHAFQAIALDEHRGAFAPALWYLERADTTDLRQCWFPGYHTDVGGGQPSYPDRPEALAINDCALAWMCDQVDGLLDFDPVASAEILRPVRDDAIWNAGITKDPCSFIYKLEIAGGSHLRTPGSYYKDLGDNQPDPSPGKVTREKMHPSIQLKVAGGGYFPACLEKRKQDGRRAPIWIFQDSVGDGGIWTRPAVESQSGCCKVVPAQQQIDLTEHIIRKRPGMNNFEWSLLPKATQEILDKRNAKELKKSSGCY